jgi:hypothetical protein
LNSIKSEMIKDEEQIVWSFDQKKEKDELNLTVKEGNFEEEF